MSFHLKEGDVVRVIAPSSGWRSDDALERIISYLESHGLTVEVQEDIKGEDLFYANNDKARALGFVDAITSEEVRLVAPIRGGEGAAELIEYIDSHMPEVNLADLDVSKKFYVGFSDSTALMALLTQDLGWDSVIHGPMLEQTVDARVDATSEKILWDLLMGRVQGNLVYDITPLSNVEGLSEINAEGVTGGNLTLIRSGVATSWQLNFKDKIVFLEDVHEYPYAVERGLTHLRQAHVFDDAKALLIGDFVLPGDVENGDEIMAEVYDRLIEKTDVPVFKIDGAGHGKVNNPLIFNSPASMYCDNSGWHLSMVIPGEEVAADVMGV